MNSSTSRTADEMFAASVLAGINLAGIENENVAKSVETSSSNNNQLKLNKNIKKLF